MEQIAVEEEKKLTCYHCGEPCAGETIQFEDKNFCCTGCKAVFELFRDTGLEDIYAETNRVKPEEEDKYAYLDNEAIADTLLDFKSDNHNRIKVKLPAIHCSSCIYLLENLHLFNKGIIKVHVNFVKQEADIHYNPQQVGLKTLAALLDTVGYAPQFKTEEKKKKKSHLSIKIGVAAFSFGNIMLLSFPEYLGIQDTIDQQFQVFFAYLNVLLALPVVFYSASDYFVSAYKGLSNRFVNIDVPIALGIIVLFGRSLFEVISQTGAGYLDSLAGLVFFLLIGKWFQSKTYENLSFDRDYKSYFPLAAMVTRNGELEAVPIADLKEGDIVTIRNQEVIPADSILLSDRANIDYSFVTGESKAIKMNAQEHLYAGGRQIGEQISIKVIKPSSQSYLTSLWNNQVFKPEEDLGTEAITNRISKYFTLVILLIAALAGAYWLVVDARQIWHVVTAVLIVACPCALALSAPFTNGNTLRIFGRNKLYLKNALGAEKLHKIDTIVFDKTGTLTESKGGAVRFDGYLSEQDKEVVGALTSHSMHPLSKKIQAYIGGVPKLKIEAFKEIPGAGLEGSANGHLYRLGSATFVGEGNTREGQVYLAVDGEVKGYFTIHHGYRAGLENLIAHLKGYQLAILSGDNDQEKQQLEQMFPSQTLMRFKQQPQDKLKFIKDLQDEGKNVMMLGDGLNDAGALKQSNMGIAVTENVSTFSPACDGILEGAELNQLDRFLQYAKSAHGIIIASFIVSFLYNVIGLSFAVSGALTPIFAAILMPLSSISVVVFTTLFGNLLARKKHLL